MKYKDTKRFLTVSRDEVNKYIEYIDSRKDLMYNIKNFCEGYGQMRNIVICTTMNTATDTHCGSAVLSVFS